MVTVTMGMFNVPDYIHNSGSTFKPDTIECHKSFQGLLGALMLHFGEGECYGGVLNAVVS